MNQTRREKKSKYLISTLFIFSLFFVGAHYAEALTISSPRDGVTYQNPVRYSGTWNFIPGSTYCQGGGGSTSNVVYYSLDGVNVYLFTINGGGNVPFDVQLPNLSNDTHTLTPFAVLISSVSQGICSSSVTYVPNSFSVGSVCAAGYGSACTSAANSCGATNTGVIQCNGSCNATTPSNTSCAPVCVANQGAYCYSPMPSDPCNGMIQGLVLCDGSCSAGPPPDSVACPKKSCVSNAGSACNSTGNVCGQTNPGAVECDGSCSAPTPPPPVSFGSSCTSAGNVCGQTQSNGTYQCNGSCSSTPPSNSGCSGVACTSSSNSCGQTNGTYNGSGACIPPANPSGYGSACTSPANTCGQTNVGYIQCNGSCNAGGAPANPSGYGSVCSLTSSANTCGQTTSANTGTYNCSGACTGTPPAAPAVTIPGGNAYGSACTSPANSCGQTQSNGTWQCNGSCSSTAPANTSCPSDLTAGTPSISPASGMSVGQSITFSSLISNIAFGPANGSFPNIFRINTSSLLGGSNIPGLVSGASANTTASYTLTSAGIYTVSACTDNNTSWVGAITESNEGNNCSADASFTAAPCTASLTSVPSTIEQGQSTTLSWSPSSSYCGFTSCTFVDGATYGGASGSRVVTPSTTSTYGLSCVGPYNPFPGTPSTYSTVTVLVPTATLTANGQNSTARVNPNTANNTTIVWSSTNSASCSVTKNGAAWKTGLSSAGTTDTVTTQTVYKIDCQNNHDTHAVASVTVNVVASFNEF